MVGVQHLVAEVDAAETRLPAARTALSSPLQWRSVHARSYTERANTDAFTTAPTRALLLVLITGGTYRIESRSGSRWEAALYRPGSVGMTAPGNAATLRWRSVAADTLTSTHIYLAPDLFVDADTGFDAVALEGLPEHLSCDDPAVTAAAAAIDCALVSRAASLYADSAAQFLAAHLMHARRRAGGGAAGRRGADDASRGGLSARALADVVAYMHAHLDQDVSLDDLARVAGLSKFHFVRMFSASTRSTPFQFLTDLRMQRGAELLANTPTTVAAVATRCGYRSASHFAAAFGRHTGVTPRAFRAARRG